MTAGAAPRSSAFTFEAGSSTASHGSPDSAQTPEMTDPSVAPPDSSQADSSHDRHAASLRSPYARQLWELPSLLTGALLLNIVLSENLLAWLAEEGSSARVLVEGGYLILSLCALPFVIRPLFQIAYARLCSKRVSLEAVELIALLIATCASARWFLHTDPLPSALWGVVFLAPVLFFVVARHWLEARVASTMHALAAPPWLLASASPIGERMAFAAGEEISADGEVVEGAAAVSERRLGGVMVPQIKAPGDLVFSGSVVTQGSLTMQVSGTAEDSLAATFDSLLTTRVRAAEQQDRALVREHWYCLALMALALAAGVAWSEFDWGVEAVLQVTCAVLLVGVAPFFLRFEALVPGALLGALYREGALARGWQALVKIARSSQLVIWHEPELEIGGFTVQEVRVLDERVESDSLFSVLLAVLSGSKEPFAEVLARELHARAKVLTPFALTDYRPVAGLGIAATVAGAEISVGTEDFLLQRGVQLQPTDVVPSAGADTLTWYAAIGDEVVASIVLTRPFAGEGESLVEELQAAGVRTVLCSTAPQEVADEVGKRAKIELASVFGGCALDQAAERTAQAALLAWGGVHPRRTPPAEVTLAPFDQLLWDTESADVLLFERSLASVGRVFRRSRLALSVATQNRFFSVGLTLFLLGGALIGAFTPWSVAVSSFLAACALTLNSSRIFVRER